jgi:hypothetical protein
VDSIDRRMLSFVTWHGEITPEATRLDELSARTHAVPWLRRTIGRGVAASHVIGYQLGKHWWTLFFERDPVNTPDGAEVWRIEAYDHSGSSWASSYHYWPAEHRWRHASHVHPGR